MTQKICADYLNIADMQLDEKILSLSAAGLLNRNKTAVMLNHNYWNYPGGERVWKEYYSKEKNFSFSDINSIDELINKNKDIFRGLVVVDPTIKQTSWIAVTLCGLENWLPVTPRLLDRFKNIPVKEDLRGRWSNDLDAADWAIENLLSRCDKTSIYSVSDIWSGPSIDALDYAASRKSFVYQLSPGAKERREIILLWKLGSKLGDLVEFYGWAEPEDKYCNFVTQSSGYIMCAEAPNLSFHAQVQSDIKEYKQEHLKLDDIKLEDKHYVALMYSEGDAPKIHATFQGGAWLDPNRGKAPINWGFQPVMIDRFPGIAEYYYKTKTKNDYFYVGPSGAGYVYPNLIQEPDKFFKHTGEYLKKSDQWVIECWLHYHKPTFDLFAELSGAASFTMPCGPNSAKKLSNGSIMFLRGSALNYFDSYGTPEDLAKAIEKEANETKTPSFHIPYVVPDYKNPKAQGGYTPEDLAETASLLDPNKFKIVNLEELTLLAKQALK